ncbi:E3 ubiquitin-protein ligase TRIM39 [Liparis tanakae]|uniref:E3 ubiquitin-protein ligase TRIM39 n=1 Tax=Liparis tanakae TaxID=230148 RepID=A0A4Z2HSV6_9TELE|nr:E3 ubiquitin-protein ligase TRIM39 [Liparis tanakae]
MTYLFILWSVSLLEACRSGGQAEEVRRVPGRADVLRLGDSGTQSSSVGAVRWTLPEEDVQIHSSAPGRAGSHLAKHPRQNGLKDLRSLQECVLFIHRWKDQVDQVCKGGGGGSEPGPSDQQPQSSGSRIERSLEESRKLILEWADELHHVDELLKETPSASEREDREDKEEDAEEKDHLRITEWAKELHKATEVRTTWSLVSVAMVRVCFEGLARRVFQSCGVQSEELGKVLRQLGLKKKRLGNLLPLLEFITWSLLKEDGTRRIPQLWLLAKQRTWTAGISRYIPNSAQPVSPVRSIFISPQEEKQTYGPLTRAFLFPPRTADVVLDPMTHHPWLQLSEDQRRVQEGLSESDVPSSSQRFDGWPCVLGWEGYSGGRHYWEVDIAKNGHWRVGVTAAGSERHGRFPMTPKRGYWVLWRSANHFYACTKPETALPAGLVPRRLGVYLDYEVGQISFYNAETESHIYTFTGAFSGKLYPLLAPLDGRTRMTVQHAGVEIAEL